MKLRTLPPKLDLRGARVFVRMDWNVHLHRDPVTAKAEKIRRSLPLLQELRRRGAITFVMTHLGRPRGRDAAHSTQPLARAISAYTNIKVAFLDVDLSTKKGADRYADDVTRFSPGDVILLENVRFQKGEETNDVTLAKRYAQGAQYFINDAFASSHRKHVSVVGLTKYVPSFAGPLVVQEVEALEKVLVKPKRPYVAMIGGAKLCSKLPVLERFLSIADQVLIGGAMAHPFLVAKKMNIGKSFIDTACQGVARRLVKAYAKKIVLPTDAIVAKKIAAGQKVRRTDFKGIKATDMIGDIGTDTMREWSSMIKTAKTIVWNGPVGVAEIPAFSHGSLVLARALAMRAKGKAYGLVGGGDTLPVIAESGVGEWIDYVSTGGGAMLEFVASNGKLPGLMPLIIGAKKKR